MRSRRGRRRVRSSITKSHSVTAISMTSRPASASVHSPFHWTQAMVPEDQRVDELARRMQRELGAGVGRDGRRSVNLVVP